MLLLSEISEREKRFDGMCTQTGPSGGETMDGLCLTNTKPRSKIQHSEANDTILGSSKKAKLIQDMGSFICGGRRRSKICVFCSMRSHFRVENEKVIKSTGTDENTKTTTFLPGELILERLPHPHHLSILPLVLVLQTLTPLP